MGVGQVIFSSVFTIKLKVYTRLHGIHNIKYSNKTRRGHRPNLLYKQTSVEPFHRFEIFSFGQRTYSLVRFATAVLFIT
uniref:Uncharacterized protein n=1 Tax=Anguilla anguilla TaxID=7936 RepID=A0A0E9WPH1_ANGAN